MVFEAVRAAMRVRYGRPTAFPIWCSNGMLLSLHALAHSATSATWSSSASRASATSGTYISHVLKVGMPVLFRRATLCTV